MAAPPTATSHYPTADQFSEVLSPEGPKWFDIGIYLGASYAELSEIQQNHHGVVRRLIELHACLAQKEKPITWNVIATALRRLRNHALAEKIHSNYILPAIVGTSSNEDSTAAQQVVTIKDNLIDEIGEEFQSLSERFSTLTLNIWECFEAAASNIKMPQMQALIEDQCGLPPLLEDEATIVNVFCRLRKQCSILNFRPLTFIAKNILNNEELVKFKADVDSFKKSAKMVDLVSLVKLNQYSRDGQRKVKLKLQSSWICFTMEQFEVMMNAILDTVYDQLSHITVGTGCICVSWIIQPSVDYTKLLPQLSLEFLQIVGVISLHIGDDVIYNVGEEGCQTLEAAMLQAIELKNTRAIELLLAVGCSPEVATYNGDHAVINMVNIRERSVDDGSGGGVDHVCVLGHNEHIEAIIDPSREPLECATCIIKEKQIKQLYAQTDTLQQKNKELTQELKENADTLQQKNKDLCLENETLSSEYVAYQVKKETEILELKLKNKDYVTGIEQLKEDNDKLHIQIDDLQDAGDSSKPVDNKAEEDIEQLKKEKEELNLQIEELKKNLIDDKAQAQNERMKSEIAHMQGMIETRIPVLSFHSTIQYPPVTIVMGDFNERRKNGTEWYSPAFYSHHEGYKLCLKVVANGHDTGKGSHVSAYIHLMAGEYDDKLSWPFNADIELQLLNRQANEHHRSFSVNFNDSSREEATSRVHMAAMIDSGMVAWYGQGTDKLIQHSDLSFNTVTQTEYLKDNSLFIQCKSIDVHVPPLQLMEEFRMENFSSLRAKSDKWQSPPFYSHDNGYKFVLRVHPNGTFEYKGKSMSVYVHLMKGKFDKKLVFPFRGKVVVQAINQIEDKNHVEFPVMFDEETDPDGKLGASVSTWDNFRNGYSSEGWGISNFLPHDLLPYDEHRNTKYLTDNDQVIFRIAKVEVLSGHHPEFKMGNFSSLRAKSDKWQSPPFYSHDNGYKFVLRVHPNGTFEYKGKSMSVYVHLMKGEFDKKLVFPFRGKVVVQAINQIEDKNHVEFPVMFNEETDPDGKLGASVSIWENIRNGYSSEGWGISNFLPHDLLPYNKHRNTKYLTDNDQVVFRIVKIEVLSGE